MSLSALQGYTYYSRYARHNGDQKRRETWNEAVDRMIDMHLRKYPEVREEIEWIRPLVREKRFLGSQRALQFGGQPIERKHARLYNCSATYCDRPRFFQEALWMLLCGSGVGFSVQKHHVEKLPELSPISKKAVETFVIPDSIEGWADALGVLIACYMPHPDYPEWLGKNVEFDYSEIRPAGSYLSSGIGKAPGPEPLRVALERIKSLLNECSQRGSVLRPIDAYDIVMHASDAVLSGGVRRSATLCMFSHDDEEMLKAKTGNWQYENPQRARSNNSVLLIRGETTKEQFEEIVGFVKECGEPGFLWADDKEALFNPCGEIGLWAYWEEDGKLLSGWQVCNLCEINGKKIKCQEDFALAARGASILGTLQAGYTEFDYLGEVSEKIIAKESLLGVSITGMMDNPHILFDPEMQKEMAKLVVKTNEWMAKKIGINPAARCTCVKPAGTTSCILGTASGIHPHHATRYLRRVQGNSLEPVLQHFKECNPTAVQKSVWAANDTDEVITFCVEVPTGAKTKNHLSACELLEHVRNTQQNWVTGGKKKAKCAQPWLSHNVSNTINVRPDEWEDVVKYIFKNRKWFAGITLLPQSGDLDYPQAPMVTIRNPREIFSEYGDGALMASGLIVDGLRAFGDLWKACDIVLGKGQELGGPPDNGEYDAWVTKTDWVRRVQQFSDRYCEGDKRRCCYLMKEVNNWKAWLDLQREYKDVDYTTLIEEEDNCEPAQEWACSGGQCELV